MQPGRPAAALLREIPMREAETIRPHDPHFHSDYKLLGTYNVVLWLLLRYPRIITSDERVLSLFLLSLLFLCPPPSPPFPRGPCSVSLFLISSRDSCGSPANHHVEKGRMRAGYFDLARFPYAPYVARPFFPSTLV